MGLLTRRSPKLMHYCTRCNQSPTCGKMFSRPIVVCLIVLASIILIFNVTRLWLYEEKQPLAIKNVTVETTNKSSTAVVYVGEDKTLEGRMKQIFSDIYEGKKWGSFEGNSFSGAGSHPATTRDYQKFLGQFIRDNRIETVLDIPCGLWTFSQYVDWGSTKKYIGMDIVQSVVETNQRRHGDVGFHFQMGSLTATNLPPADLLICKDALQHLSLHVAAEFLNHTLTANFTTSGRKICKYRYVLVTNDIFNTINVDTSPGGFASRDIAKPPFDKKAEIVLKFQQHPTKFTQLLNLSDPFYACTDFLNSL